MAKKKHGTNWTIPIILSLLVGVVAFTVTERISSLRSEIVAIETNSTPITTVDAPIPTTTHLLLGISQPNADRDKALVMDKNGKLEAWTAPPGWRAMSLPKKQTNLNIEPSEDRGSRLTDGAEWNVVLRSPSGDAYQDPLLLGMFDDTHAAIYTRGTKRVIVKASRSGSVTVLAQVPDNAQVLGYAEGAVWYSTYVAGEGIESEPVGPSTLYRVTSEGKIEEIATDPEHVFVSVLSDVETW